MVLKLKIITGQHLFITTYCIVVITHLLTQKKNCCLPWIPVSISLILGRSWVDGT